jgi:endonuclease/exonuclease/phosphatase family metal-dependent hydrolase
VSLLFAGIAALALLELGVNLVVRPQSGPFALGAAFEPHLLVVGAVAGGIALLLTLSERSPSASRIRVLGIVMIVIALVRVGGEWWSPDDGPNPVIQTAGTTRLSVMSWNLEVGSKTAAEAVDGILDPPGKGMPDVVALQELTPAVAVALEASAELDVAYPYRMLEPRDGVRGMGILSSVPLVKGAYGAFPMLLTAALLLPDDTRVDLLDVHPLPPKISTVAGVPWGLETRQRDKELESLRASLDRTPDPTRTILVGDLNTTPFEPGFGIVAHGLVDAHERIGSGTGFTWRPAFLEPLHASLLRIDHMLTGPAIAPVTVAEDCSLPGDHCRLVVQLEVAQAARSVKPLLAPQIGTSRMKRESDVAQTDSREEVGR